MDAQLADELLDKKRGCYEHRYLRSILVHAISLRGTWEAVCYGQD